MAFNSLNLGNIPLIDGNMSTIAAEIQDTNGLPPSDIIDRNNAWQIQFKWSVGGAIAVLATGTFDLEVDTNDNGARLVLGQLAVPAATGTWNPVTNTRDYQAIVPVAANVIAQDGVYRVNKHLVYTSPVPTFRTAAFAESESVNFF